MPIKPNVLERLLLFRSDLAPAPMLDLFGAAGFEAVCLAVDLGVFDALADGERTAAALAADLGLDARGLRPLLGFLDAQGYVTERSGRFRNTRMTDRWLTSASATNVAPWFTFWNDLVFPFWEEYLETAVREGDSPLTIYEWLGDDPARWEVAQRGFRAAGTVVLDEVATKVDVPAGATRLLDVGGGHGLFAIELCYRRADLAATVFDLPEALGVAREEAAAAGLDRRVRTRGGDYLEDDLGDDYDLALLFNVIHAHDGAETVDLFGRVFDALAPGGWIAVFDQLAGSARTPVGRAGLAFVDLTYATTLGANIHAYDDVAEWLRAAGFEGVRRTSIRRAGPGNALVEAAKPGAKA